MQARTDARALTVLVDSWDGHRFRQADHLDVAFQALVWMSFVQIFLVLLPRIMLNRVPHNLNLTGVDLGSLFFHPFLVEAILLDYFLVKMLSHLILVRVPHLQIALMVQQMPLLLRPFHNCDRVLAIQILAQL